MDTLIIMARVAFAAILITIGLIAVVHGHMSRGLLHIKGNVLLQDALLMSYAGRRRPDVNSIN
jgi:hypothetical protein